MMYIFPFSRLFLEFLCFKMMGFRCYVFPGMGRIVSGELKHVEGKKPTLDDAFL